MSLLRLDVLTARAQAAGDTTHYAIATRAGIRESTVSRVLGGRTTPSLPTLAALAHAYDISLDDLVSVAEANIPGPRSGAAA